MSKQTTRLRIIPLGGMQEIGKNITVVEYGDDMIIVDCGIAFPKDDMPGIDIVIPDFSFIEENKEKIRGIVLTHGHEDHIGAVPYLLRSLSVPVYGTALTLGLLQYKLAEHHILSTTKLEVVKQGQHVQFGKISVEFINSNHSIADAAMLAITTPLGIILHTSDFKIDYTPVDDKPIDLKRIAQIGQKGVLLMMADSTNSERNGYTISEKKVGEAFESIFRTAKGRIIVATFASNVHRIQHIINASVMFDKKIVIFGRSMQNVISKSIELGYLTVGEGVVIDPSEMSKYPPDKLVLISTGTQGEPMSALTRMAFANHKKVEIGKGDLVVISASVIPGNEKHLFNVINELFKKGAEVIYESLHEIHVSGHACREELKLLHNIVKPKYFIPAHGEYRHFVKHAQIAREMGMDEENIFIMENGQVLEISGSKAVRAGTVNAGNIMVDGLGVGDVGTVVLRDRKHLAQDGIMTIVVTMEKNSSHILSGPDIISRGFIYMKESEELIQEMKNRIIDVIKRMPDEEYENSEKVSAIKKNLRKFIYDKTKRNPMIIPIITEV
ncbi:MAG: ribonuclease J [Clostridia bacterium]